MGKVGIAISGGGHRASLFGLGVLVYLADADKNGDVVTISSVSGGSITNAFVGLQGDYSAMDSGAFRTSAARMAEQIANRGTLFGWWVTRVYLAVTALGLVATFLVWVLPWHWFFKLLVFLAALMAWDALLLGRRGDICARSYSATVLKTSAGRARLESLGFQPIDHVLCATHLNAGEHMYLSGRFAYSYRFGWGKPSGYPLDKAVQASTALPGAFPPRWLPRKNFNFSKTDVRAPIALVDGGVYDNMADQWFKGLARRAATKTEPKRSRIQVPDEVLLVNASASMKMSKVGLMRVPLLGEVLSLMRDVGIMYDNSASLRKSDLIDRFDLSAKGLGSELGGALIDIGSNPCSAPEYFGSSTDWPERAARAPAAKAVLSDLTKEQWQVETDFSAGVKTNLSKLGVEDSARILRHAYALATATLHVVLDYPPRKVPDLDDFRRLCST